jgi:hypothetical protein
MRPKEAKNSQMMKEQGQQMEDVLPESCHSVCDETRGGKELTDDERRRTAYGRFNTGMLPQCL